MDSENLSQSFERVLKDLLAWFRSVPVDGLIIGGVALVFLSRPRFTKDVDALVVIDPSKWEEFLKKGKTFGFFPRITDALIFARNSRVLLLKHEKTGVAVDISLGALPFEKESLKRRKISKMGNLSIPHPTPEDFIIMKAVAHRPQDLADIDQVLLCNAGLNTKRIRRWVKEFARVLEMPEMVQDLEKILKRKR